MVADTNSSTDSSLEGDHVWTHDTTGNEQVSFCCVHDRIERAVTRSVVGQLASRCQ